MSAEVGVFDLTRPAVRQSTVRLSFFAGLKALLRAPEVAITPREAVVTLGTGPSHSVPAGAAAGKGHYRTSRFVHIVAYWKPLGQFNNVDSH